MTEPLYTITYILGVAFGLGIVAVLIVAARRRIIRRNEERREELMEWGDYDWTISNEEDERE